MNQSRTRGNKLLEIFSTITFFPYCDRIQNMLYRNSFLGALKERLRRPECARTPYIGRSHLMFVDAIQCFLSSLLSNEFLPSQALPPATTKNKTSRVNFIIMNFAITSDKEEEEAISVLRRIAVLDPHLYAILSNVYEPCRKNKFSPWEYLILLW